MKYTNKFGRFPNNTVEITYNLEENNCKIYNSWKIKDYKIIIEFITYLRSNQGFNVRSEKSYLREWKAHNLLYDLHLFRSHTVDVDLDVNEALYRRFVYFLISWMYVYREVK